MVMQAEELEKELVEAKKLLDKAHGRLCRWMAEYPEEANLTKVVADEIRDFLGEELT